MGDLMAVAVSGEDATLFLIDPVNKQMSAYSYDGRALDLNGARQFGQDLLIEYYERGSDLTVEEARELVGEE
jgi:hypothetical protein